VLGHHPAGQVAALAARRPEPRAVDHPAPPRRHRHQRQRRQRDRDQRADDPHRDRGQQPLVAALEPAVDVGHVAAERRQVGVVDERPRLAVHRHVAAQEDHPAGAAAAIEPAQHVDREVQVARELHHPVDQDAGVGHDDEPAGAALAGHHHRAARSAEAEDRRGAGDLGQHRRVVGHDLGDAAGQRVAAGQGRRDRRVHPRPVVAVGLGGVDLGAQEAHPRQRRGAVAEVVSDDDVAAGLDERRQVRRLDALQRVDQHQDVALVEVAPLERAHRDDLVAQPGGDLDEGRHAVPRLARRVVVAERCGGPRRRFSARAAPARAASATTSATATTSRRAITASPAQRRGSGQRVERLCSGAGGSTAKSA
jgi:hypothetical protein